MMVLAERFHIGLCALLCVVLACTHGMAQEAQKPTVYRIESQIYLVRSSDLAKSSFARSLSEGQSFTQWSVKFRENIGKTLIEIEDGLVEINGQNAPRSTDELRFISAPTLMALSGQRSTIAIQDPTPIQYMERVELKDSWHVWISPTAFEESLEKLPEDHPLRQPVDIKFQEMDLENVISLLAEKGGINVIMAPNLSFIKVTAKTQDVPLGKTLVELMKQHGYGLVGEENLYRVVPLQVSSKDVDSGTSYYTLREAEYSPGIELSLVVKEVVDKDALGGTALELRGVLDIGIVEERERISKVTLDVGKPVIKKYVQEVLSHMQPGRWVVNMSWISPEISTLVLMRVEEVEPMESKGEEGTSAPAAEESRSTSLQEPLEEAEESVRQYVVEAKFLEYEGRLDKERVKALRRTLGVETSNEDVFRLVDGVLPARRGDIDMLDRNSWEKDVYAKFDLLSAPRITFPERRHLKDAVKVFLAKPGIQGDVGNSDFAEDLLRRMLPDDRVLPISKEEIAGKAMIGDIVQEYIPYKKFYSSGVQAKTNPSIEAHTGVLLLVGLEERQNSDRMNLDVYCQFSASRDDLNGVAENREEAIGRFLITDFRDRFVVSDGGTVAYLHSVSDKQHRIVVLSVNRLEGIGPMPLFRIVL